MNRYAFDVDGVVSNTYGTMVMHMERRLKCTFFQMPYDVYNHCQMTKEEFLFVFNSIVINDMFLPMEGAINVLTRYQLQIKKPLTFISHRDVKLNDYTIQWLKKYLHVPFELHSSLGCDKTKIALELGNTGIIEDQPYICKKFIDSGLQAICISQPWHKTIKNFPAIPLAHNWIDVAERILE